ncbi:DnaJ domain-containing protein [Phycomyces nitens]|nr:DnaJ domain-containing protein [Phycomyces nitens]
MAPKDFAKQRHRWVEEVLSASNYYDMLGIPPNATAEDIRQAYIKKSRVCHPDRFVPPYPRATESFQALSLAYNTLRVPNSRWKYDMKRQCSYTYYNSFDTDDTFEHDIYSLIFQLYNEILQGQFHTLRTVLMANACYAIARFEILQIYELQEKQRALSYFDIRLRLQHSIAISKILISLPLRASTFASNSNQTPPVNTRLLGPYIEQFLNKFLRILEIGESYI